MLPENNTALKLHFDTDTGSVVMAWTGFTSSSEFQEINEEVLKLLKEKNATKILADVRHMKIISLQDQ